MSASSLTQAADDGAAWPWLTAAARPGPTAGPAGFPGPAAPGREPGPPPFPRVATRAPEGGLAGVGAARRFARATLEQWQAGERADDITLVLSELLTNALRYAAPRTGGWPVRAGLLQARPGAAVLCAVADASPAPPVPQPPGHLSESGRGLRVVEELSDGWGYTAVPRRGKVVWATFGPGGPAAPGGGLARV
jgi:hypothetical protein